MDGACTSETVGSYEATCHIPMTDWRRLIRVCSHDASYASSFSASDLSMAGENKHASILGLMFI